MCILIKKTSCYKSLQFLSSAYLLLKFLVKVINHLYMQVTESSLKSNTFLKNHAIFERFVTF